ncbi:DUF4199 domain-containing protein [bacterium]|nr:DUF4199 domain-containing protein [bacterium]
MIKHTVKHAMKYGAIIGIIGSLITILAYLLGALGSTTLSVVSVVISIGLYVYMVKYHRDHVLKGVISLKDIVILVMLVVTFSTFISTSINIAHLKLSPSFMKDNIDLAVNAAEKMADLMGLEGAKLDEVVNASIEGIKTQGIMTIIQGSIITGLLGSILGLILGAIFKKEEEVFDNEYDN